MNFMVNNDDDELNGKMVRQILLQNAPIKLPILMILPVYSTGSGMLK